MPPSLADFPVEVQEAFFIYGILPDKIDSMAGIYLGKDWTALPVFFDIYEIQDRKNITDLLLMLENTYKTDYNKKAATERAKKERASRAKHPGKNK